MQTQIDAQDLIDMLVSQRNDAQNALAQTNAALKGALRRIAELEEAANKPKEEPKPE